VLAGIVFLGGCASKPPTIAHTHVGHVMTGWADTPDKKGLLETAEIAAQSALQSAESAADMDDINGIKAGVWHVINATDTRGSDSVDWDSGVIQYSVRSALVKVDHHITFAAESRDVSENIRNFASTFHRHSAAVVNRCDTIALLGQNILDTSSPGAGQALAGELLKLVRANVDGNDTNGDGVIGSSADEYGLKQLRSELQAMLDREDPPYKIVDTWYLFNLIKLPSGDWIFRFPGTGGSGSGTYQ
jgi:hypothetical protein